ncbi:MAG TPA: hypothetical protein VLJ17_01600, partial [Xanthobacteraceae bacterium]|nr:hypothetical protein [Xanthobacteraceae bacterium]
PSGRGDGRGQTSEMALYVSYAQGGVSPMSDMRKPSSVRISRWLQHTPVHTFVMCPLFVVGFEHALNHGRLTFLPWGAPLLAWGYLQYRLVGNYRLPRAGGPPAWMLCRSGSSRRAHIATRAIRCISATSSSWRDWS